MNFNHQLAGATLYFSGKILDVRQATAEDVAKLNGCGCNCNGHDCSCVCDSENDCDCGCGCC
jgi:FKBP-type peptidyl-prolyl cis-trans isomerase SlyD